MDIPLTASLFPSFAKLDQTTSRARFSGVIGGEGSPVLLLHGYPQTHATWHVVAPDLAERHTVVIPDLPGYGRSELLDPEPWDKRAVAAQLVELMQCLGYDQFAVVGHDRGARVGYRLTLDHQQRVLAYCSAAVVPTLDVWPAVDREFARSAFHWFMFLQPGSLPEELLSADPDGFLDATLVHMAGAIERLHPTAVSDYREAFRKPSVRSAMIKDYRAAYDSDEQHDEADRLAGHKITCPVLVLWPRQQRLVAAFSPGETLEAITVWRRWADDVQAVEIDGGHLLPEQAASAVSAALLPFLERTTGSRPKTVHGSA